MFVDIDLLPLSALQHFVFCTRQCALIHIEQIWSENLFTAEGRVMHERVHEEKFEKRGDVRIERGVPLRSLKLGLIGKADAVEFHKESTGRWSPFPVEYKRGKPKESDCDKVQLCAQALCLEEMIGGAIPAGALFYGKTRRHFDVVFDDALRAKTVDVAKKLHKFIQDGKTPPAQKEKRCDTCSLSSICLPKIGNGGYSVADYVKEIVSE